MISSEKVIDLGIEGNFLCVICRNDVISSSLSFGSVGCIRYIVVLEAD